MMLFEDRLKERYKEGYAVGREEGLAEGRRINSILATYETALELTDCDRAFSLTMRRYDLTPEELSSILQQSKEKTDVGNEETH